MAPVDIVYRGTSKLLERDPGLACATSDGRTKSNGLLKYFWGLRSPFYLHDPTQCSIFSSTYSLVVLALLLFKILNSDTAQWRLDSLMETNGTKLPMKNTEITHWMARMQLRCIPY